MARLFLTHEHRHDVWANWMIFSPNMVAEVLKVL